MIPRSITHDLNETITVSPAIMVHGARQTGKSTLIKSLADTKQYQYITLDNITALSAAKFDPQGFITGLNPHCIIDEIQKAPELLPAIKESIDQHRTPGRFILTGSANIFALPKIAESLAGRISILTLYPFSQSELTETKQCFIDTLISENLKDSYPALKTENLVQILTTGGYPEALRRKDSKKGLHNWFKNYIATLIQRDIRDIADITGITELPKLLSILANRSASLLNFASLSRDSAIPASTLKRYISYLEALYLFQPLPAWSKNTGKRLTKSPKIHLNDTGLICHILGTSPESLTTNQTLLGHITESFIVGELNKHLSWSQHIGQLYHYRSTAGSEVDIVFEQNNGDLYGIEIKTAQTVTAKDFKGLKSFQADNENGFKKGIVFYLGDTTIPFGEKLLAVPMSALWND